MSPSVMRDREFFIWCARWVLAGVLFVAAIVVSLWWQERIYGECRALGGSKFYCVAQSMR